MTTVAIAMLASGASALVIGNAMPLSTTRSAAAIMQVGPMEQEGRWEFRHGPGQLADQGALAWATAGGPAEYIAKPHGAAVAAVEDLSAAAFPAAAENPVLSSSATRDPEEAAAKAAWLAKTSSGSVAPTRAPPVPISSGPPAPLEKERQWEFRHGAGRLQPISCGGP